MNYHAAFPIPDVYHPNGQIEYGAMGLTKREYFAGVALQGLLVDPKRSDTWAGGYAREAVAYADALLAELARKGEGG